MTDMFDIVEMLQRRMCKEHKDRLCQQAAELILAQLEVIKELESEIAVLRARLPLK